MSSPQACSYCPKVFTWGKDKDSHLGVAAAGPTCGENAYWKLAGHMAAEHPSEGHRCGRRNDLFARDDGSKDWWGKSRGHRSCSYCGSMHPDDLFAAIDAGTCQISGTDKNYKIYVDVPHPGAGEPCVLSSANFDFGDGAIKVTPENIDTLPLSDAQRKDWRDDKGQREHWVRVTPRPANAHAKFYYQHFDDAQQQRFLDLYNEKKLPLEPRFGLYVLPYFARAAAAPSEA